MLARYWGILVRVGEVMLSNTVFLKFLRLNPRKVISCLGCMPSVVLWEEWVFYSIPHPVSRLIITMLLSHLVHTTFLVIAAGSVGLGDHEWTFPAIACKYHMSLLLTFHCKN